MFMMYSGEESCKYKERLHLKKFDTKPGELLSEELIEASAEAENSVNPTEISDVEAEVQEVQADATAEEAQIEAETETEETEVKAETETQLAEVEAETETEETEVEVETETQITEVEVEVEVEVAPPPSSEKAATRKKASVSASVSTAGQTDAPASGDTSASPVPAVPGGTGWFPRERFLAWAPYGVLVLLGAILRFWNLGDKPLHHDESLHAYFSLGLLHNLQHWSWCLGWNSPPAGYSCYTYDPLLHGPFQFHAIALVYQISQWLGAPDNGVNTVTVRIPAALLGTLILFLPYFLKDYLGKFGTWLATFFLAISPSMVYFSRFAREDIYMACFTMLMVVATGRYMRERRMRWILLAAAGFALSYATSEATFLTIAVFGSFLGALIVWEIGAKFSLPEPVGAPEKLRRFFPRSFGGLAVLLYFIVLGVVAKFFFATLDNLSTYINSNTSLANQDLANLEATTLKIIPWLGIVLGIYVFSILAREVYGKLPLPGRRGLARFVDRRQPVLDTILTMSWTHWFFALILGWGIFLLLFTVVFTNIGGGIGDGIWKGLYYWLEQQNVDRGGQPWYYYLMLIPLYEQVGVVFAVVGIVRSVLRPNRFRLFLVYWFLGNFFLYSWAGEKMPWLMILITMPMMLLAAVGLEPSVLACYHFARERFFNRATQPAVESEEKQVEAAKAPRTYPRISPARAGLGVFGVVMALLLLAPTLHNMYEVTYVHPADGPYEMMVYVQTTNDVKTVMDRIDEVNQKDFGGNHQMRIGVTNDATWPFAWYLRDYPNLCFGYPDSCPDWKNSVPIVISGGDDPYGDITSFAPANGNYLYHEYNMRSWWDEGYKLPPCPPGQKPTLSCADPNLGSGVGPLLWLSYGDNPPPGAKFNPGLAFQRIWNWWWNRVPFGSTTGAYNMELFIQKGMGVTP
jgi:uncharacterized protein (TIGR03663 family)